MPRSKCSSQDNTDCKTLTGRSILERNEKVYSHHFSSENRWRLWWWQHVFLFSTLHLSLWTEQIFRIWICVSLANASLFYMSLWVQCHFFDALQWTPKKLKVTQMLDLYSLRELKLDIVICHCAWNRAVSVVLQFVLLFPRRVSHED